MTQIVKVRNMMRLIAATSAALMAMSAGQAWASVDIDSSISGSGPDSHTAVENIQDDNVEVEVNEDANFETYGDIELITGENTTEDTTESGDHKTGDAEVEVALDNTANSGEVELPDDFGDVTVNSEIKLSGPDSETLITNEINRNVVVDVNKTAEVNTDLNVELVTGKNSIKDTTYAGELETGNASFEFKGSNDLNTGNVDLSNIGSDVNLSSTIEKSGPDSTTEVVNEVNQNTEVTINKDATINTNFDIHANTGENEVEDVTEFEGLKTGDAKVKIELNNKAN